MTEPEQKYSQVTQAVRMATYPDIARSFGAMNDRTIYIIVIEDRHFDTKAEVWTDREQALRRAKSVAEEMAHQPGYPQESTIEGWLYYAHCSPEGDHVWVVKSELKP